MIRVSLALAVMALVFALFASGALLLGGSGARSAEAQDSAALGTKAVGTKVGAETGLPLPRWAALKNAPVHARVGPGTKYPVEWEYLRQGLPVRIVDEFEHWRRVADWQGAEGWVHRSLLIGQARFQVVRAGAGLAANPTALVRSAHFAELGAGVVGDLLECTKETGGDRGGNTGADTGGDTGADTGAETGAGTSTASSVLCEVRVVDSERGIIHGWVRAKDFYGGFPPE